MVYSPVYGDLGDVVFMIVVTTLVDFSRSTGWVGSGLDPSPTRAEVT